MPERVIASALTDTGAGGAAVTIGGIGVWRLLQDRAQAAGYRILPLEQVNPGDGPPSALLWDFGSHALPPRVPGLDAERVVSWSLESPLIAHRAYHRLPRIGRESAHVFGFAGVGSLLGGAPARFHDVNWPNDERPVSAGLPWRQRRLLSLVNSNKRAHHWSEALRAAGPVPALRVLAAAGLARTYPLRRTWSSPELYVERLRAVEHFADVDGFDLFGAGWDRPVPGGTRRQAQAIARTYRGSVADKTEALSPYRFSLVVENTSFPGYISEKLYDCLFAGTIPVYLGAPDVADRLPEGVFVDLRAFESLAATEDTLRGMSEQEGRERLAAGRHFVESEAFSAFRASGFADRVWSALADVLEH